MKTPIKVKSRESRTVGVRMPDWMLAGLLKVGRREQSGISRLVRLAVLDKYLKEMGPHDS